MGLFKPFCALAICCLLQIIHDVSPMTINEPSQDATNSSDQFELEKKNRSEGKAIGRLKRKAYRNTRNRWPDAIIPIEIQNGVFSMEDMVEIEAALDEWRKYTCIKFKYTNTGRRVRFQDGSGCSSFVGRWYHLITHSLTLGKGCRKKGIIIHEIGHAVGFYHEQARPDRDRFVRIKKENIPENEYKNFRKYSTSVVNTFSLPYDYKSVMHYDQRAFSTNDKRTIETVDPDYQDVIGNREGLSCFDVKMANLMYNCAGRNNCPKKNCPDGQFLSKDCKCWCCKDDRNFLEIIIYGIGSFLRNVFSFWW